MGNQAVSVTACLQDRSRKRPLAERSFTKAVVASHPERRDPSGKPRRGLARFTVSPAGGRRRRTGPGNASILSLRGRPAAPAPSKPGLSITRRTRPPGQIRIGLPIQSVHALQRHRPQQAGQAAGGGGRGGMRCSAVRERRQRPPSRSPLPAGASGDPSQVRRRDQAGIRPKRRYVNRHRPRRGEERKGGSPSLATAQAVCCPLAPPRSFRPASAGRRGLCVLWRLCRRILTRKGGVEGAFSASGSSWWTAVGL